MYIHKYIRPYIYTLPPMVKYIGQGVANLQTILDFIRYGKERRMFGRNIRAYYLQIPPELMEAYNSLSKEEKFQVDGELNDARFDYQFRLKGADKMHQW